jgi:hypothetical protein
MADSMEDAIKKLTKMEERLSAIAQTNKRLNRENNMLKISNREVANTEGLIETQYQRVDIAIKKKLEGFTRLKKAFLSYNSGVVDTLNRGREEQKLYESRVPIITRYMIRFTNLIAAVRVGQNTMKGANLVFAEGNSIKKNMLVTVARLALSLFSLMSVFTILGVGLMVLSAAFQGLNSPLLEITANLGPLHDAMQGLVLVFSGEGETGMAGAFNIFAAATVVAVGALLLLGPQVAIVAGAATIAVGVFQLVTNATGSMEAGILAAVASFAGVMAIVLALKAAFLGAVSGAGFIPAFIGALTTGFGAVLSTIALVGAGIVGLFAYASGAGEGIKGVLLGIGAALLLFAGLAVAVVSAPVAAVIAAVAFVAATIYRYRDEIAEKFTSTRDNFMAGLEHLRKVGPTIIRTMVALVMRRIQPFIDGYRKFKKTVKAFGPFVAKALSDARSKIENRVKKIINGIFRWLNIALHYLNQFQVKENQLTTKLGIAGAGFDFGKIEYLAKGGVVNTPTLAMVGEAGPEAVVPLNRASQFGKTDVTVNINVSGVTDRSDKRALAREISDIIAQEMRRNGGAPTRGRY